ncbi:unnamed protein product [Lampetra planeri]
MSVPLLAEAVTVSRGGEGDRSGDLPSWPQIPVTLNMKMMMPAWFDLMGLSPESPEDESGIKKAADNSEYFRHVRWGVEDQSTPLVSRRSAVDKASNGHKNIPILQCHGEMDVMIPLQFGNMTAEKLKSIVNPQMITFKTYPGASSHVLSSVKQEQEKPTTPAPQTNVDGTPTKPNVTSPQPNQANKNQNQQLKSPGGNANGQQQKQPPQISPDTGPQQGQRTGPQQNQNCGPPTEPEDGPAAEPRGRSSTQPENRTSAEPEGWTTTEPEDGSATAEPEDGTTEPEDGPTTKPEGGSTDE